MSITAQTIDLLCYTVRSALDLPVRLLVSSRPEISWSGYAGGVPQSYTLAISRGLVPSHPPKGLCQGITGFDARNPVRCVTVSFPTATIGPEGGYKPGEHFPGAYSLS